MYKSNNYEDYSLAFNIIFNLSRRDFIRIKSQCKFYEIIINNYKKSNLDFIDI